jgi:Asp-tRNA(Asn)/Glu-tRNA(Gln) amidotransferase A subunit family amidase
MTNDSFFELSIEKIHEGYRSGEFTPTEIAYVCINRVKMFEPQCHAWVTFSPELLLDQAYKCESGLKNQRSLRQIEGIPIGIKDIFNTADFQTEMGSPIWKDFTPGNDARVVFYLRQQGALIPGKTVTAEFAVHTLGKTLNPHDLLRTPGTSSSGSAVAVATGMVPVAMGTQTAGSIVRPASFCGIYGCKPSFGLIPRTGMLKTTDSLDTVGFFCLHYLDLKRIFNVIRVYGPDYPISHAALMDKNRQAAPVKRPWKVAFTRTPVWDDAHPYAQKAILEWIQNLGDRCSGVAVHHVDLPHGVEEAHNIHATIYNKTLSYYFKEEFSNDRLISPIMKDLISEGNGITSSQYESALRKQEHLEFRMNDVFKEYDIILSLSTAGEAPLRDEVERPDPALIWTLCHLPVISAPIFLSPAGLPFGMQIVAARYNDLKMFHFCNYLRDNDQIPECSNPRISS